MKFTETEHYILSNLPNGSDIQDDIKEFGIEVVNALADKLLKEAQRLKGAVEEQKLSEEDEREALRHFIGHILNLQRMKRTSDVKQLLGIFKCEQSRLGNIMTTAELKERVYDILDDRIRPRIDQKTLAGDESATIQHAVNIALGNIAILATNSSKEVAINYLYDLQRKTLKSVTREMVRANAYVCLNKFRTEILAFREMHKLLDEDADREIILQRVQHILDTEAKEFDVEPGAELTPSVQELMRDCEPDDEASFMKRSFEYMNAKMKIRKKE